MPTATPEARALAAAIRELRRRENFTQHDLSLAAGFAISYVAHLERSAHNASFTAVARLAAAMDVDLSEVVELYKQRLAEIKRA